MTERKKLELRVPSEDAEAPELKKKGLEEATGVSTPAKGALSNGTPMASSPAWANLLVMQVWAIAILV